MGELRKIIAGVGLYFKILEEYDCEPQFSMVEGTLGFNVHGREVGRVVERNDGEVDVVYYKPGSERFLPVFSERVKLYL
jgi:hypothetical protein